MLKKKEEILLFEKISRLSHAGLMQRDIAKQIEKYGTTREKQVAATCIKAISDGSGFSQGLKPWVSPNAYLSLLSGEKASNFEQGINDALDALRVDEASGAAIVKVMVKPILGVVIVIAISALLGGYAFPYLAEQAPRAKWGFLATSAETFGVFWFETWLFWLFVLAGAIPIISLSLSRYCGEYRNIIDKFPIYRQYRFIQCTNFLTSTAHQTAVGTSIKESLQHYQEHANPYMKHHVSKMLRTLGAGKSNIGDILDSGLLDAEELDTLKLLSDTGRADLILKKSAVMHSTQLLIEIDRLKKWGSRFLYSFFVLVGAWNALGIGLLAFDIATNIKF